MINTMHKKYDFVDDEYLDEEKYLFLLLFASGKSEKFNEKIKGNTWLQKQMYLLKEVLPKVSIPFTEHYYGAYSPTLNILKEQNVVSDLIKQQYEHTGKLWLSKDGMTTAHRFWKSIPKSEQDAIINVKNFMNDMDMWELIAYSYSTFPETIEKSDVVEQFEKTRLDAACSLFFKNKVSLKKSSSIAGLCLDAFIIELKNRNIPAFKTTRSSFNKSLEYLESIT